MPKDPASTPTLPDQEPKTKTCDKVDSYIDPDTGFMVFTKEYHLKRGYCCKSQCRHCPWNYRGEHS